MKSTASLYRMGVAAESNGSANDARQRLRNFGLEMLEQEPR